MMTDSFSAAFAHLHLLKHPFYQAWTDGTLAPGALREYATQYYHHVDRFPRYLSAIHSNCEDSAQRRLLLENLNDEEGTSYGVSHPELWLRFAEGVGAGRKDVMAVDPCQAIRNVASTFFWYARSSLHEGLGALFAYESQVPEISEAKLDGLKNMYGIRDARSLSFFEVHRTADLEHRSVILEMLEALPPAEQEEAREAGCKAAQSLWDFLTEMNGVQAACA